ncbi:MAG: DUF5106 domain-containing protein [Bacteroidaceae bacterium]|nr:DUF5106 domain-containing protein [Bacteroidaceae bacterium]
MIRRFLFIWAVVSPVCCAFSQQTVAFPYPDIPSTLVEPQERLTFVLNHFWEQYHFDDTTLSNRRIAEQGIADFLNLLNYESDSALCRRAVDAFVEKGFANEAQRGYFEQKLTHYLSNPESPLRNESVYAHFLRGIVAYLPASDAIAERSTQMLRLIGMNAVGDVATDFCFRLRDGQQKRLSDIKSPFTLLIFSDPECEHCREALPRLVAEDALKDERLSVLLVYPDSNTPHWLKVQRSLPANWWDVCSPNGEIMRSPLYHLPSLPSLYLLDARKCVLIKDGTLEQVTDALHRAKDSTP